MPLNNEIEEKKRELALKRAKKFNTKDMVPSKKPSFTLDLNMSITELYCITGYTLLINNKGQIWVPHDNQLDNKEGSNANDHPYASHMHILYDTFLFWMKQNNYSLTDDDAVLKMEELANSNNYFYVIIWPNNANYRIEPSGRGLNKKAVFIRNINGLGNPVPLYKKFKRMSKNEEAPPPDFSFDRTQEGLGHGTSIYKPYDIIIDTGRNNFFR